MASGAVRDILKKIDFGFGRVAAGYSGMPLQDKLGIKPGMCVAVVGAPPNYEELVGPLPLGAVIVGAARDGASFIHLFVERRARLAALLAKYRRSMAQDGILWVSWPKRSSGVATDITEDAVRELALRLGLVDVKVCAVDETWSALKLVVRRELRDR